MNSLMSQRNLLITLAVLLSIRFVVVPILNWQSDMVGQNTAKYTQLQKIISVVENKQNLSDRLAMVVDRKLQRERLFFSSEDNIKLNLQKEVEGYFGRHNVKLTGFNWLIDDGEVPRVLRASLSFSAPTIDGIKALLQLSLADEFIRQVEWRFRFVGSGDEDLGSMGGDIVLEFYVLSST